MRKIAIGDLVYLSRFSNGRRVSAKIAMPLSGLVTEVSDSNVYEPAEAQVYFGNIEEFEWYPVRSLSLVPDEEREGAPREVA